MQEVEDLKEQHSSFEKVSFVIPDILFLSFSISSSLLVVEEDGSNLFRDCDTEDRLMCFPQIEMNDDSLYGR
jgi:hypothetical protein